MKDPNNIAVASERFLVESCNLKETAIDQRFSRKKEKEQKRKRYINCINNVEKKFYLFVNLHVYFKTPSVLGIFKQSYLNSA